MNHPASDHDHDYHGDPNRHPPPYQPPNQGYPPVQGYSRPGVPPYQPPYSVGMPPGSGYPVVAPKNPALSLIVSFFLPGVGSMINDDVGKGVGILLGYLVSCALMIILIGFLTAPIFWIWGMVDAYQGAKSWNARHGIIS